jgi:serine/threonine-protein kinase PRP4
MSSREEPVSKRRRVVVAAAAPAEEDAADPDDLAALLVEGDDFVSAQERQSAEAERRRAQRRERLRRIAGNDGTTAAAVQKEHNGSIQPVESTTHNVDHNVAVKEKKSTHADPVLPNEDETSGIDSFDMFGNATPVVPEKSSAPSSSKATTAAATTRGQGQQDWDDVEGYYNAVIGETIEVCLDRSKNETTTPVENLHFRVDGAIGKGVFSTVLKVTTTSNASSTAVPPTVAIKMIRHNESMANAATNEIRCLHRLRDAQGIIPLLLPTSVNPLEYRGHVLLVFPFLEYNLRDVLQKFGKGVGLSLPAVSSYFGQLLSALTHLKKRGIIHADLKPDNILVNGDFSTVYLADFGSAFESSAPENQPTPYLVSRFYRAPEIILGLTPTIAIDLWSLTVSIAELFLGNLLFRGKSNNDMLYVFMQHLGAVSNRIVRQHVVQLGKVPTLARQFQVDGANFVFLQQTVDGVTGQPIHKRLPLVTLPSSTVGGSKFPSATPLSGKIVRAKSANDSRTHVQQFADLLQKCLALDPSRRMTLKDAMGHDFFKVKAS